MTIMNIKKFRKEKKQTFDQHMTFIITKDQRERLKKILKENNISLSKFVRQLIFGS